MLTCYTPVTISLKKMNTGYEIATHCLVGVNKNVDIKFSVHGAFLA